MGWHNSLKQGWVPRLGPTGQFQPVASFLVNNILLDHSHTHLSMCPCFFSHYNIELHRCARERMASKAQNICNLDLCRKSLPIPSLENIWKCVWMFGVVTVTELGHYWHSLGELNYPVQCRTALTSPMIVTPLGNSLSKQVQNLQRVATVKT